MIEKYISKMSISDVTKYSKAYGISLSENETKILYDTIKKDWKAILYGDYKTIINGLKAKISVESVNKLEKLLIEFKKKYYNYL